MKRLLLDQGLPRSAVTLLARAGWDAVHVSDLGMGRTDDAEIVKHAVRVRRLPITRV